MQHYNNFAQRMHSFQFEWRCCRGSVRRPSRRKRLRGSKQGKQTLLLGHTGFVKGLEFKELCLLIIDEERASAWQHKEALKEIRKNVDVLTLTATPIPRTLHMAMVNIR